MINSSSLMTIGYGENHRVLTQGYGKTIDFGPVPKLKKKEREYIIDLTCSIFKENQEDFEINNPVEILRIKELPINSKVDKTISYDFNFIIELDYQKLSEILDEI